ncbi:uncharacterized protein DUF4124 [Marinicella litoralis]|uniref:Uncharacterized protein DUF4124 n=2 Tax=Marinicella litoralis TaxID=644220 RepID=A0A4R6Y0I9_9GAMM|nr:uncharacterized protein DUF4124 [Marinicella litoralis]
MVCFLLCLADAMATVYKCVDENQTIHYQNTQCDAHLDATVMNVTDVPEIVDYSARQNNQSNQHASSYKHRVNQSSEQNDPMVWRKQLCNRLWSQYKKAQKEVVRKCKKARDIYCDQDADQIEQTNLNRDIRKTARSYPSRGNPQLYLPQLFQLKNELKNNGCW